MPNLRELGLMIAAESNTNPNENVFDKFRQQYLKELYQYTGRNIIAYYSGWLNDRFDSGCAINDRDKSAFMMVINGLDRTKGLDLILHTPGGDVAATESLIEYLSSMFDGDIRAIVPQLSMSGGTMIALACREIIMGKHSNLGPIDPQFKGAAAQAILDEFENAKKDIKRDPNLALLWQPIIEKYHSTLLISCQQAIDWSRDVAKNALARNMCSTRPQDIGKILEVFANHSRQKAHNRHIPPQECIEAGLSILMLEQDQTLQDAVLSVHHCYHHTLLAYPLTKIIENHNGASYIEQQEER